jgi:hypothetical protein
LIYEIVKKFLITTFKEPNIDDALTPAQTKTLYSHFKKKDVANLELFRKEIRRAFSDFFEPIGTVLVLFKGFSEIILKIKPYEQMIASLEADLLQELSLIIFDHDESLSKAKDRDDLLIIDNELYIAISNFIKHKSRHLDGKELAKKAIVHALSLSPKDLVVIMNNRIVIRMYKMADSKGGSEQRYNGLPENELKKLEMKTFPEEKDMKNFFKTVAKKAVVKELNFCTISNEFFIDNYIKIIQKHLFAQLKTKMSDESYVIEGFGNYIFRDMFEFTQRCLAIELLERCSNTESEADHFIRYYNGEIHILKDGSRAKVPQIVDEDGHNWNYVTIRSLYQKKTRAEAHITKLHQKVKEAVAKVPELEGNIKVQTLQALEQEKLFKSTTADIEQNQFEVEGLVAQIDELELEKSADEFTQKRLAQTKIVKRELEKEIRDAIELKNARKTQSKDLKMNNENLKRQVIVMKKQAVDIKKTFDKHRIEFKELLDRYNIMLSAVTTTISKKKDLL